MFKNVALKSEAFLEQQEKFKKKSAKSAEQHENWRQANGLRKPRSGKTAEPIEDQEPVAKRPRVEARTLPTKLTVEVCQDQDLLPPHCVMWESKTEKRIRGFYEKAAIRDSTSASYTNRGMHDACLWCLQWAYQKAEHYDREPCPFDGLMTHVFTK